MIGSALARDTTMTDEASRKTVAGSATNAEAAASAPPHGAMRVRHAAGVRLRPDHDDVHRAHLLQTMIRTHVFGQARNRLVRGEHDTALDDLSQPLAVSRLKKALYSDSAMADARTSGNGAEGRKARPRKPQDWLADHPAPLPLKLAFLESVARSLGDDWCNDASSFLDVTMAMGRLQLALRQVMLASTARRRPHAQGSALVTVPPGEEHQFAQCIIEELFRARGWSTDLYCPSSQADMIERIDEGGYDIVCLSWSTGALADVAATAITRIEQIPTDQRPAIIAGGVASLDHSGWLVRLGVDCVCDSTYGALAVAQAMLKQRDQTGAAVAPPPQMKMTPPAT